MAMRKSIAPFENPHGAEISGTDGWLRGLNFHLVTIVSENVTGQFRRNQPDFHASKLLQAGRNSAESGLVNSTSVLRKMLAGRDFRRPAARVSACRLREPATDKDVVWTQSDHCVDVGEA